MIQMASPDEQLFCLMTHVCLAASRNSSTVQYASVYSKESLNMANLQSVPLVLMSTITSGEELLQELLQASGKGFVLPIRRAQRAESFSRLFYLYEGLREASPGLWKGVCSTYMEGSRAESFSKPRKGACSTYMKSSES